MTHDPSLFLLIWCECPCLAFRARRANFDPWSTSFDRAFAFIGILRALEEAIASSASPSILANGYFETPANRLVRS